MGARGCGEMLDRGQHHFVNVAADDDDSDVDKHNNPFSTDLHESTLSAMLLNMAM